MARPTFCRHLPSERSWSPHSNCWRLPLRSLSIPHILTSSTKVIRSGTDFGGERTCLLSKSRVSDMTYIHILCNCNNVTYLIRQTLRPLGATLEHTGVPLRRCGSPVTKPTPIDSQVPAPVSHVCMHVCKVHENTKTKNKNSK